MSDTKDLELKLEKLRQRWLVEKEHRPSIELQAKVLKLALKWKKERSS